jgi:4-amino-4-deoxy-L-arabinose transferase-like glycosyltransferase
MVVALWQARTAVRSAREGLLAAILVVISFGLTAAPVLTNPDAWTTYHIAVRLAPLVSAWVFLVGLPVPARSMLEAQRGERASGDGWSLWGLPQLLIASFLMLAAAHWMLQREYVSFADEPLYLLQSRLLLEPGFVRHIDESLRSFFVLRQTVFDEGHFYTQYPPGQPALLALFDLAGLRWWSGVLLSTAGVLFTYLLGRRLYSEFAGRAAAAFLGTNLLFVTVGSGYMAHGSGLALATAAAWLFLRAETRPAGGRSLHWWGAGTLLSMGVAVRPLTGATLSASLLLWQMLRRKYTALELGRLLSFFVVGSAPPLLGLFYYNEVTNGAPFKFGYEAANGTLHDLGFGLRGWMLPGAGGETRTLTVDFTAGAAVEHFVGILDGLSTSVIPAVLWAPLVFLAYRYGYLFRWRTALAFLVLPAGYFLYFVENVRFYVELLPFFYVAIAGLIGEVRRADLRLGNLIAGSIVAAQLLVTGLGMHASRDGRGLIGWPAFAEVREAQRQLGKVLAFVEDDAGDRELLLWLSWFNVDGFPGNVVVARDLGKANERLRRQFPGHIPVYVTRTGKTVRVSHLPGRAAGSEDRRSGLD